jgi:site-specific recombinase XerD
LAHLDEHTNRYVEDRLSGVANPAKAYAEDLKRFCTWCAKHGLKPLPASVDTLAGFVTILAEIEKKGVDHSEALRSRGQGPYLARC